MVLSGASKFDHDACKWDESLMAARGEHKYKNSSDKHGHAHEASANKQCNSRQDVLVAQGQADCTRHANSFSMLCLMVDHGQVRTEQSTILGRNT